VYVDGCLSRGEARAVRERVEDRGHQYIRAPGWCYPNQARNIGLEHAGGASHVVFIDNDVFVQPGWLEALVRCAEETGAGVVGPLYLEGKPEDPLIHCAGGQIDRVPTQAGKDLLVTQQYELGLPLAQLSELSRTKTGLVEFHCVLLTRRFLDAIGSRVDEGLLTTREHVDLCLLAEREGFEIYLEPASRVRYENTRRNRVADIDYFMFRWSKSATVRTIEHFERKWQVMLDPQRCKIIADRRARFIENLEQRPAGRFYAPAWKVAQHLPVARTALRWAHRNVL
jgi:GT2 family glycosyltransferase